MNDAVASRSYGSISHSRILTAALTALLLFFVSCSITQLPAQATPSSLVVIPTAETLGASRYSVEPQVDITTSGDESNPYFLNTQIGVGSRFETGIDFDLSSGVEHRAILNAKYLLGEIPGRRTAVAVGFQDAARGQSSSRYLTLTRTGRVANGHGGIMRAESRNRWFVGIDSGVTDRVTIMGDYTHGSENCSSIGVAYQLRDELGLLVGAIFPNEGGPTTFSVYFIFGGSYARAGTGDQ